MLDGVKETNSNDCWTFEVRYSKVFAEDEEGSAGVLATKLASHCGEDRDQSYCLALIAVDENWMYFRYPWLFNLGRDKTFKRRLLVHYEKHQKTCPLFTSTY